MREIKFRAWAFDDEFMIDDKYNDDDFVFVMKEGKPKLLEAKFDQANQMVSHYGECNHSIMQYTGLKDKNGVEIYEGDVVKSLGESDYCFGVRVVEFVGSSFTVKGYGLYGKLVEVIGNIHQNPELLEK